jgi:hypothetical protein
VKQLDGIAQVVELTPSSRSHPIAKTNRHTQHPGGCCDTKAERGDRRRLATHGLRMQLAEQFGSRALHPSQRAKRDFATPTQNLESHTSVDEQNPNTLQPQDRLPIQTELQSGSTQTTDVLGVGIPPCRAQQVRGSPNRRLGEIQTGQVEGAADVAISEVRSKRRQLLAVGATSAKSTSFASASVWAAECHGPAGNGLFTIQGVVAE